MLCQKALVPNNFMRRPSTRVNENCVCGVSETEGGATGLLGEVMLPAPLT